MLGLKFGDTLQPGRQHFQFFAIQITDNRLSKKLLPPALGLPIIHNQIGISEIAGRAEIKDLVAQAAVENDPGIAEGQKVTATGTLPIWSLTISCQIKMRSG